MRQAGRYLPEYKKIRSQKRDFLKLCFCPTLASKISLQPIERFDLDFIILFSDILVIPFALGQKIVFKEKLGPVLDPVTSISELKYKNLENCIKVLEPVFDTLHILNNKKGVKKLIGFCGGPFTVLTYMIEGGTSKDHKKIKNFIKHNAKSADELINLLIEISIRYLKKQIEAGAEILQVFDSWAGLLHGDIYERYIINPNKRIFDEIQRVYPNFPMIFFPRKSGKKLLDFVSKIKCHALSLDDDFPAEILVIARRKNIVLQGNLNPNFLLNGGKKMEIQIKNVLEKFKNNLHIFNLSHGILPKTPIENIYKTIKIIREFNET